MARSGERLLEVLLALNKLSPCSVLDLHRSTGLSRQAIYRAIEVLSDQGFVSCGSDRMVLTLTSRVTQLSVGFRTSQRIADCARKPLDDLQQEILWPTSISTYDSGSMRVVYTTQFRSPFVFTRGGEGIMLPLLQTAMGLAYLSFVAPKTRKLMLDLCRRQEGISPAMIRAIVKACRLSRETGYAFRRGGLADNTSTVAVPIRDGADVCGAICYTFLHSALPFADAVSSFLPVLKATQARIEQNLCAIN